MALVKALRAGGTLAAIVFANENTPAAIAAPDSYLHRARVQGVDHHDYADELSAHSAEVAVTDLAELLVEGATSG